jgi:hypothetical protein
MVVPERWGAAPAAEDRRAMGFVYLLDELAWACALLEPAAADCRATRRRGLGVVDGWCGLEAALVLWRWGFEGMVDKLDLFLEPMRWGFVFMVDELDLLLKLMRWGFVFMVDELDLLLKPMRWGFVFMMDELDLLLKPMRWGFVFMVNELGLLLKPMRWGFVFMVDELGLLLKPMSWDFVFIVDMYLLVQLEELAWACAAGACPGCYGDELCTCTLSPGPFPLLGCPLGVKAPWRGGGVGVGSAAFVGPEDELVVQVREVVPVLAPRLRPSPGLVLLWPRLGSLLLHHCRLSASRGGLMLPS